MRYFRALDFGFVLWVAHVLVAGVLLAPVLWFGRRRARWDRWDMLPFVLPFTAWWLLFSSGLKVKSLANAGEAAHISVAIAVAAALRMSVGHRGNTRLVRIGLLAVVTLVAVGVYLWTPVLPEVNER